MFLDVNKKLWIVNGLEIPVIENIGRKDLKWFKDKSKWAAEREEKQDISPTEALKVDEEWCEKVCKIGLGLKVSELDDSGITDPDFRELMVEVYNFLSNYATIKRAKLSVLYDPETAKKDLKLLKTTQS